MAAGRILTDYGRKCINVKFAYVVIELGVIGGVGMRSESLFKLLGADHKGSSVLFGVKTRTVGRRSVVRGRSVHLPRGHGKIGKIGVVCNRLGLYRFVIINPGIAPCGRVAADAVAGVKNP